MSGLPPLGFTTSGAPVATPPAQLNAALIALVAATNPGYTILPAGLIEDLASTGTGILVTIDQSRVDEVNAVNPATASPYRCAQLGQQFGIPQGLATNGSVLVVFTGSAGYTIPPGFTVSDGSNTYVTQEGGVIGSGGTSASILFIATSSAVFSIPANTVQTIVTSVPSPYTLTATNPGSGTPANSAETTEAYQSQLLQAWNSPISGWQTFLKTLLQAVPGVNARLISVIPNSTNWEVLVGGSADPYAVAYAIYQGVSNIGLLAGSYINSGRNVSVSIYDAPNTYSIVFVPPVQITTTVAVTWNTTLTGFTAAASVNQFIVTAIQSYINGIVVGQPINLLVLTENIQQAISGVLAPINLTTLTFVVTQNSSTTGPTAGTSVIPPVDNESFFYVSPTGATSVQG